MSRIWYLLKCPEGNETDIIEKCRKPGNLKGLEEIVCFQYQRMMRYGGRWHVERRAFLPGYIFLSGSKNMALNIQNRKGDMTENKDMVEGYLRPCELSCLKRLCPKGSLIGMSRGLVCKGIPIVTSGPLKGQEQLIRRIDRHKRTAEIEMPFEGEMVKATVGLEIYQKEI